MPTGYWVKDGHIYHANGGYAGCWIDKTSIYSVTDGYIGWLADGHIYTTSGYTGCWVDKDNFVYGDKKRLPWVKS